MDKRAITEQSKDDYLTFMKGAVASFAPGRIEFLGTISTTMVEPYWEPQSMRVFMA